MKKHVYFFGADKTEGKKEMKQSLGGKGANLAEMASLGVPVPPGFTITTETCAEYYEVGKKIPLKYLSTYLGIKPQSLSRIRRTMNFED